LHLITYFSLTILGCDNLRNDLIYLRLMHYYQELNFLFIFLIATISPLVLLIALYTDPYAPSPINLIILYRSIINQLNDFHNLNYIYFKINN